MGGAYYFGKPEDVCDICCVFGGGEIGRCEVVIMVDCPLLAILTERLA